MKFERAKKLGWSIIGHGQKIGLNWCIGGALGLNDALAQASAPTPGMHVSYIIITSRWLHSTTHSQCLSNLKLDVILIIVVSLVIRDLIFTILIITSSMLVLQFVFTGV